MISNGIIVLSTEEHSSKIDSVLDKIIESMNDTKSIHHQLQPILQQVRNLLARR